MNTFLPMLAIFLCVSLVLADSDDCSTNECILKKLILLENEENSANRLGEKASLMTAKDAGNPKYSSFYKMVQRKYLDSKRDDSAARNFQTQGWK
ncbi:hypothetical protein TYRP_007891 [Tyrophagus putrescentiae]|nr:hypothetical protein TYRP_007891 [Tyrophagus putrescentiae]